MKSLWNDKEASAFKTDLAQRVYSSRLLGKDKTLVLHGGGNTSVKTTLTNIVGEDEEILYVKGSGWDLEFIEEAGFSPVRMGHLLKLARLKELPDPQMVNELVTNTVLANAPTPSVETILHAVLPYKFVDHTHANALLAVMNTADGMSRLGEIYGDKVVVIPYVMPGFDLAKLCVRIFPKKMSSQTIGMVLMNHGIFSFGSTARESYERMIKLVNMAEAYLKKRGVWKLDGPRQPSEPPPARDLARLRSDVSRVAGVPLVMLSDHSPRVSDFIRRDDLAQITQRGPATPDHVIRTKRIPMVGLDINKYAEGYEKYFASQNKRAKEPKTRLDSAPRVILDKRLGMAALGRSVREARVVADIYRSTMDVIERAESLGGWCALPAKDIFDVEYWDLEQAKLRNGGSAPVFSGEVALVTGAASGIGMACVKALLGRGAAVVGLDVNPAIKDKYSHPSFLGIECDIRFEKQVSRAIEQAVQTFGAMDMLILNAGVFPSSDAIATLKTEKWRRVLEINLDTNLCFLRECHGYLSLAPRGGRVVVIGSKNVPAPGVGAAAYSASKAALTQLARIAALEWGQDRIRVNTLHPDAVFDTGIWSEDVLRTRAKHYGISIDQYKTRNVLKSEVLSVDVAEMAATVLGPIFAKTTGAQVPIDGGNDRVI
jgi:rhamnose utilization protein RhaD (predicted bifunctional aldolase and dehydrogenase)/NAD(P)-dependent dehydrogenase (short-subunit alcohol dehydrogenase family)